MTSLQAYFDGNAIKTVENYHFEKNQKFLITIFDESEDLKSDGIKSLRGCLSDYAVPELIEKEKSAWAEAAEEKHGLR